MHSYGMVLKGGSFLENVRAFAPQRHIWLQKWSVVPTSAMLEPRHPPRCAVEFARPTTRCQ